MTFTAKIEQTYSCPKRMKYIAKTDSFIEKDCDSLSYVRSVRQPYGWIKESGTPPCEHLDVIVMTDRECTLGEEIRVNIVGVFLRCDGDNKLVGVPLERDVSDFSELTETERQDMRRLYPRKYPGEGWFGREEAERVVNDYFSRKKRKTIITVQHTQSQHHVNGMIGAWGGWELTEEGRRHAFEVGKWLRYEDCQNGFVMYTSDLKRAAQTAEEINRTLDIPCVQTEVLREVNAGEGNGKPRDWYNAHKKQRSAGCDPDYKPFPDAESDRDLWQRIYPFYQKLLSGGEERLLIVSHGTALSFLHRMLMGYTFDEVSKLRFTGAPGSVTKFIIEPDGQTVLAYLSQRVC